MPLLTRRDCLARWLALISASRLAIREVEAQRRRLTAARIESNLIKRIDVGLRPFRPAGFVVRAEKLGEKSIVHNYGHGGAGVTLSWGTSWLARDLTSQFENSSVAVLGCGAVGLTCAILMLERNRQVTIYSEKTPPHTTSNVAAAQWAPYSLLDTPEAGFQEQLLLAAEHSWNYYQERFGDSFGIRLLDNYVVGSAPPSFPWEVDTVKPLFPELEDLPEFENPFGTRFARRFKSFQIDTSVYLPRLLREFRERGGRLQNRSFSNLQQIKDLPEKVVFNCMGLGTRRVFQDAQLRPIKGQLTVLEAQPQVDYVVIANGLYMMPRSGEIVLGGTFERGVETLIPNPVETQRIWAGHRDFFSRL